MARAAHSFYLRNTYLENNLIKPGKLSVLGEPTDLRRIHQDIYTVGAEKDHIVPWRSALAHRPADAGADPLRARGEWAYCRHDQPAIQRQRRALDERHSPATNYHGRLARRRGKA
jgi:hypothetical protein